MREDLLLLWVYAGDSILSVQVSLGPGNFVPSTGEMKLAVSISWVIGASNIVASANS